jgi:hypothetical protein
MSILKYNSIDFKKINYTKPEKKGTIYYSPINYDNQPLHIQTPRMVCKSNGGNSVKINSPAIDCETLNSDFSFYDFLISLDDRNVKETHKNNKDWFGKDIPLEMIDDMYKRINKPVKKDSKPKFSFKLPVVKGKVQCLIYDQKQICVDIQKLVPDCEIIFVLHIRGLKFLKQHYYCDCYISQIKVFLNNEKYSVLDTYVFDDEEENKMDQQLLDNEIIENLNKEKAEKKKKEDEKNKLQEIVYEKLKSIEIQQNELKEFQDQLKGFD